MDNVVLIAVIAALPGVLSLLIESIKYIKSRGTRQAELAGVLVDASHDTVTMQRETLVDMKKDLEDAKTEIAKMKIQLDTQSKQILWLEHGINVLNGQLLELGIKPRFELKHGQANS